MRYRKARGKKKAAVTLTEKEVVIACDEYIRSRLDPDTILGSLSYLKIAKEPKKNGGHVEYMAEIEMNGR